MGLRGYRRPQRAQVNQRAELPVCSSSSTWSLRLHLGQGTETRPNGLAAQTLMGLAGFADLLIRFIATHRRHDKAIGFHVEHEFKAADMTTVGTARSRTIFDRAVVDLRPTSRTRPRHSREPTAAAMRAATIFP